MASAAANGTPASDAALEDLLPGEDDLLFEEELLRNPYSLRMWIRYLDARKSANPRKRYLLYERALNALPGSYKVRPVQQQQQPGQPLESAAYAVQCMASCAAALSTSSRGAGRGCRAARPASPAQAWASRHAAAWLRRAAPPLPPCHPTPPHPCPLLSPPRSCGTPTCLSGWWRCGGCPPRTRPSSR